MKKIYLVIFFFQSFIFESSAQNTIWSDNFDSPSGGMSNNNAGIGWTLNTEGSSSNKWFINTPSSIGCSSSGNALHISCTGLLCGFLGGPNEPIYSASGNNSKTAISPTISTIGISNITLSFDFICEGSAGTDFGTLALSNDGGLTWTDLLGEYSGVSSCSTKTVTFPSIYENIPNLKMRFKWQETDAADGFDPPFSIDNIQITTPNTACVSPVVDAGISTTICLGQSLNLGGSPTATGGSGNGTYTYEWSPQTDLTNATSSNPTANPSTSTTYTLTVSQGGAACTGTSTVSVNIILTQLINITPSGIITICDGQTIPISASSGFTNYSWNTPSGIQTGQNIIASLPGTYSVSAFDANNCTASSSQLAINPIQFNPISVNVDGNLILCPGDNVLLIAETGLNNYQWTNGSNSSSVSITTAGTYSVTAQNTNGCSLSSEEIVITNSPSFAVTFSPVGPIELCEGEEVVLVAQSGYSNYQWSDGTIGETLLVSQAGDYSLSASNEDGCIETSTSTNVFFTSLPLADFTFSQTLNTEYEVEFTNNSNNANTFEWNFGGNNTSNQENPIFIFEYDNIWPVTLIISNNCGYDTLTLDVNVIKNSIYDLSGFKSILLSPNPGNDFLQLSGLALVNKNIVLNIYDLLGRLLISKSLKLNGGFSEILETTELTKGIYVVTIESNGDTFNTKWIKE